MDSMKSNFALRTFALLSAWLIFENFNLSTVDVERHPLKGSCFTVHDTRFTTYDLPLDGCETTSACKSMESRSVRVSSEAFSTPYTFFGPPYKIRTIVLDAGHGGKDPGCKGASALEKDNALAIVLRLGAYIEANYPAIKVIYTRETDVFIELNERAAIANRNNADLFISVHCNAIPAKSAIKGAETYVLGLHRTKDNLEVAKRENASIYLEDDYKKKYEGYDPNSPEAEIFANLWQSAYLEQSIVFASYVQQFSNAIAFREDRGVKQAGFLVLRETAMPSVLIETGYLTNATEETFLASEEGREQMAVAIFQAFDAYKRHMETGVHADKVIASVPVKPAAAKVNKPTVATTTPGSPAKASATSGSPAKASSTAGSPAKASATAGKPAPKTTTSGVASVKTSGPKPAASPEKVAATPKVTTPSKPQVAPGYTIFLLSWPNRLDPDVGQLSLLANVKEIKKEGKYHYYSGTYASKPDAEKVLPEIQNMGFKTATIVQF